MSENTTREMILKMRERNGRRGGEARGRRLDELCELCDHPRGNSSATIGWPSPHRPSC